MKQVDKISTVDFVEFDTIINVRLRQDNLSRDALDKEILSKIAQIFNGAVHD
jgi:hypothetical protein